MSHLKSRVRTHAVLVIDLYELLGNPTTYIGPSMVNRKQSKIQAIVDITLHRKDRATRNPQK